jgi:hypothetical protein
LTDALDPLICPDDAGTTCPYPGGKYWCPEAVERLAEEYKWLDIEEEEGQADDEAGELQGEDLMRDEGGGIMCP